MVVCGRVGGAVSVRPDDVHNQEEDPRREETGCHDDEETGSLRLQEIGRGRENRFDNAVREGRIFR